MKISAKRLGRVFVVFARKSSHEMHQSVLVVDGSFILPNNLVLIVRGVQEKFKNAKISVLTFQDKVALLKEHFPEIEIVVPSAASLEQRHPLAFELFGLRKKRYRFVVLSSLNIPILAVAILFVKAPLFLHNRWLEWYAIRWRTLGDVIRRTRDADQRQMGLMVGFKEMLKAFGRFFVILTSAQEREIGSSVLWVDNGHADIRYVLAGVRRALETFINPHITVLTLESRKHYFENTFLGIEVVGSADSCGRRGLAWKFFRLKKGRYSFVVLVALDTSLVMLALLCTQARVFLYNRWHEWWSLRLRNMGGYLRGALFCFLQLPFYLYLFISAGLILSLTQGRLILNIAKESRRNHEF